MASLAATCSAVLRLAGRGDGQSVRTRPGTKAPCRGSSLRADGGVPRRDQGGIAWEPYSRHRLEELVDEGKTVFVDFTADWCLTCKANEVAAIERPVARLDSGDGLLCLGRQDETGSGGR